MKNQSNVMLPAEVEKNAESVSTEKRNEVQSVLNHVFDGVSKMRIKLETIIVTDENDNVNMKLANTIRLGVRKVRLDSEKVFDAKRAEVQTQMLNFKTEDLLWLKAKQDAEKKAKAAPDKEKLNNLATLIEELTLPNVNSEQAEKILKNTKILLRTISSFIREKASLI